MPSKPPSDRPKGNNTPDPSEPLHNFIRNHLQTEETVRRWADSMKFFPINLAEQLIEQYRNVDQAIKGIIDPIAPILDSWRGFDEHQRQWKQAWKEQLLRFADYERQIEELFRRVADPTSPIALAFRTYAVEENRLRDLFSTTFAHILADSSAANIAEAAFKLNAIFAEGNKAPLELTSDAQIRLNENSLPIRDAAAQIDEFISKSEVLSNLADGQLKLSEAIDSLADEIRRQNTPLRFVLFNVLFTVLIGYFINITTPHVDEAIHRPFTKKEIIKKLQTEATSIGLQPKDLQELRVIVASALKVRETPSRTSMIIGILNQGRVVKQVTKGRDWTLVEFSDGDITHRGWVFTRYLKRLAPSPR